MKRLSSTFVLAAALLLVSCDDENGPISPSVDAAVDAGATDGGTGPMAMCTGTFATINRATLGAATKPGSKCSMAADLDSICTRNIGDIARACGQSCVGAGDRCLPTCVKNMMASVSDDCLGCYAQVVSCTKDKCFGECVNDPKSAACAQCQVATGCLGTFFACSGLPGGPAASDGGTGGDGGASDGAASSDGGTDAAAVSDGAAADSASGDAGTATDIAVSTDGATD